MVHLFGKKKKKKDTQKVQRKFTSLQNKLKITEGPLMIRCVVIREKSVRTTAVITHCITPFLKS